MPLRYFSLLCTLLSCIAICTASARGETVSLAGKWRIGNRSRRGGDDATSHVLRYHAPAGHDR